MTHKQGGRNPKSQEIRNQWQAAGQFVQDQAGLEYVCDFGKNKILRKRK